MTIDALRLATRELSLGMRPSTPNTCEMCEEYQELLDRIPGLFDNSRLMQHIAALTTKMQRLDVSIKYLLSLPISECGREFNTELTALESKNEELRDALLNADLSVVRLKTELCEEDTRKNLARGHVIEQRRIMEAEFQLLRDQLRQAGLLERQMPPNSRQNFVHRREVSVVRISEMSFDV